MECLREAGYQLSEHCDSVFLRVPPVARAAIFTELRPLSGEGGADTANLVEGRELEAFLSEGLGDWQREWDEYPEPLWDPLKSEVELLVRDYFEQADADTD
jgi:hypothetical protein